MSRHLRFAIAVLCAAGVIGSTGWVRHHAMGHYLSRQKYEDVYYLPPAEWLPVFSLGHREALADLIWMKALIYFGDELYHRGEVEHLYDYTEAMLSLDRYFKAVYQWVASCALYRTGTVTARDAKRAIGFLERGVELFPDDGELAWDLGATYSYELSPLLDDPEEKAEAKRRGLEHLQVAVMRGAGPAWLALANAGQLDRLGHTEQAVRHLEETYDSVQDPDVRKQIETRLAELKGRAYAQAFGHAMRELEQARKRNFPYLSTTLYVLVGSRPPFDGLGLMRRNFDPLAAGLSQQDVNDERPEG